MTQPLALLVHEKLLPGSQLANRLQDTGWRVQALNDPAVLAAAAAECRPMIVLADLQSTRTAVAECIGELRRQPATAHVPVIAYSRNPDEQAAALQSGATLAVDEAVILQHLAQFIDQALADI
jgi:CheY-like chemotaxis protein